MKRVSRSHAETCDATNHLHHTGVRVFVIAARNVILSIVFCTFLFEFVGLVFTESSYLFGFFFWMDLLGTMSMVTHHPLVEG